MHGISLHVQPYETIFFKDELKFYKFPASQENLCPSRLLEVNWKFCLAKSKWLIAVDFLDLRCLLEKHTTLILFSIIFVDTPVCTYSPSRACLSHASFDSQHLLDSPKDTSGLSASRQYRIYLCEKSS